MFSENQSLKQAGVFQTADRKTFPFMNKKTHFLF